MTVDEKLSEYDVILHHVLLPRVLPQEKSPKLYEVELNLMTQMVKNVVNLVKCGIPSKTVELFRSLHEVHMKCNKENISKAINSLQPGDTFAMFVRLQHTGIMIYKKDSQNIIVSTIPSLHPEKIYKHDSDYEVIFHFLNF